MPLVARLASPPEYRKLAPWFAEHDAAAPTMADMVLLVEDEGRIEGALRVVMGRGLIRLDSVIASSDAALSLLLQQANRWIGREACWALAPAEAVATYIAAGYELQCEAPDTLKNEAGSKQYQILLRTPPQEAAGLDSIAQAASEAGRPSDMRH